LFLAFGCTELFAASARQHRVNTLVDMDVISIRRWQTARKEAREHDNSHHTHSLPAASDQFHSEKQTAQLVT